MRGHLPATIAVICLLLCNQQIRAVDPQPKSLGGDQAVAPVTGESWLNHLHRPFGDTSMGKTGRLGPPAPDPDQPNATWLPVLLPIQSAATANLHGSDLYRLNCQGCHGEAGLGAPPEINSVINPVRATSVSLVMARMRSTGMEISPAAAAELAAQSKLALLQRLQKGGESMPPFPHLNDSEVRLLLSHLNKLAGVTPAGRANGVVHESPLRVGELIAKSTCHICHDATGENPSPQRLEDGAIPPLETLTARVDKAAFVRKVTAGASVVMGTPPTPHRGRMPVFYYLTPEEAGDVYLYLATYRPSEAVAPIAAITTTQANMGGPAKPGTPTSSGASVDPPPASLEPTDDSELEMALLLGAVALFVIALLAGGVAFTLHEFRRLTAQTKNIRIAAAPDRSQANIVDYVA